MILLTGITGLTGGNVAKHLLKHGARLRALVRSPEKAADFAAQGVDIVTGDLADKASIVSAMDGCDSAFVMMNNCPEQLDHEKRFINAAKDSNLSHVVKLSATGAKADDENILKHYHGASEGYLKASGLPYTIVRANFFMQYLLYFMPMIEKAGALFLPGGNGKMALVDVRDVAEVIALSLLQPEHKNKTYSVSGPEALTYDDIAKAFETALHQEVKRISISREDYKATMLKTGASDWNAAAVAHEFEYLGTGAAADIFTTFEDMTGRKPQRLTEFLSDALG